MQRNRDLIIGVSLLVVGFIGLGMLGFILLRSGPSAEAQVSPTNPPLPSVDIGNTETVAEEPTFIATAPAITTREPVEATSLAELTDQLQDAWAVSPTPSPDCEIIQIDLSNDSVYLLKLDRPMSVWYGANEGTSQAYGPIIDSEFVFQGNTFRDYAIPHNASFVFGFEFKLEPGEYEISVRKWSRELGRTISPASYELRLCP